MLKEEFLTRGAVNVRQFHFDTRRLDYEADRGTPETLVQMDLTRLDGDDPETHQSSMVLMLRFLIPIDAPHDERTVENAGFVVSGLITQTITVDPKTIQLQEKGLFKTKKVTLQKPQLLDVNDLSLAEKQLLVQPLLETIQRLTYEVTEIAFDVPGYTLNI